MVYVCHLVAKDLGVLEIIQELTKLNYRKRRRIFGPIGSLCNRLKVDVKGIDLKVSVLTTLSWRIARTPLMCTLTQDVVDATVEFEEFYLSDHNGRVLIW